MIMLEDGEKSHAVDKIKALKEGVLREKNSFALLAMDEGEDTLLDDAEAGNPALGPAPAGAEAPQA
ncbi:hypothetical protein ACP4OV_025877 [Aristida adscensionis]